MEVPGGQMFRKLLAIKAIFARLLGGWRPPSASDTRRSPSAGTRTTSCAEEPVCYDPAVNRTASTGAVAARTTGEWRSR